MALGLLRGDGRFIAPIEAHLRSLTRSIRQNDFVRAQANLVLVDQAIDDKHTELQALKKVSPNHLVVRLAGPLIEEEYKTSSELKGALSN